MAHQIYKDKCLFYRQPAWHGLGTVIQDQIGAVEAARRIELPSIITEPVVTATGLETNYKAIIGELAEGKKVFSVVSNDYHEITHKLFVEGWDKSVKQHVESIGLLMGGAGLFLSAKLPTFDVKGDEISAYILAENWLTGTRSTKVRKTPVRVVCMNTLQMSDAASLMELRICHTKPAVEQLEKNLLELIERSTDEYKALKEVYELLASTKVTSGDYEDLVKQVYPDKPQPKGLLARAATDKDALDKLAEWERSNGRQIVHRDKAQALFLGDGVGSQSEAAAGTAWGAYNSVVEYEQYAKRFRTSESAMFGAGKDRVAEAFEVFSNYAGIKG